MAKEKTKRVIYYTDPLNDDFAGTKISQEPISEDYKFIRDGLFFKLGSFVLTFFIATPIIFIFLKFAQRLKVRNRKVLRKLRGQSFFLYGNHTHWADSYIPQVGLLRTRKAHIIANADATSIKGIKTIVEMLGAVPLPDTSSDFKTSKNFAKALEYYVNKKKVIAIYPEAHIWPYYTGVRPFISSSFSYPVQFNVPVVAMATTYQKSKWRKKPRMIITLSDPIYPDLALSRKDAKDKLRNDVYDFMVKITSDPSNYAYIEYVYKKD